MPADAAVLNYRISWALSCCYHCNFKPLLARLRCPKLGAWSGTTKLVWMQILAVGIQILQSELFRVYAEYLLCTDAALSGHEVNFGFHVLSDFWLLVAILIAPGLSFEFVSVPLR